MPRERGEQVIATNRRARFDYEIEKTYEADPRVLAGALDEPLHEAHPQASAAQGRDHQALPRHRGRGLHAHPTEAVFLRRSREGRDRGREGQARVREAPDDPRTRRQA